MQGDSTTTRHTRGPWKLAVAMAMEDLALVAQHRGEPAPEFWRQFSRRNEGHWVIVDDEGSFLAIAAFQGTAKRGEAYRTADPKGLANARLIAAAPDLLAALEAALPAVDYVADEMPGMDGVPRATVAEEARAAIAAAKVAS